MSERHISVTFKVTPAEKAELEAYATSIDRPVSWVVRQHLGPVLAPVGTVTSSASDTFRGEPWPDPNARLLTTSGPPTVTTVNRPTSIESITHVGVHPAMRPPAEKIDLRNDAQKRQAARDDLLRGSAKPVTERKRK